MFMHFTLLLHVEFCVDLLRFSMLCCFFFFFSSRRRHTRLQGDWSSDVCSSDLDEAFRKASSAAGSWAASGGTSSAAARASVAPRVTVGANRTRPRARISSSAFEDTPTWETRAENAKARRCRAMQAAEHGHASDRQLYCTPSPTSKIVCLIPMNGDKSPSWPQKKFATGVSETLPPRRMSYPTPPSRPKPVVVELVFPWLTW